MGQVLFLTATGVFLQRQLRSRPLNQGKESAMRRRSERHTLDQRLKEEKARIEARLEAIEPGPQRDLLELKVRQIETAFHMERFLSSTGRPGRRAEPA